MTYRTFTISVAYAIAALAAYAIHGSEARTLGFVSSQAALFRSFSVRSPGQHLIFQTRQQSEGDADDSSIKPSSGKDVSTLGKVRTPREALEEATQVTTTNASRRRRSGGPDSPPDAGAFQTESQRRRNLPLSQLKRVKPRKRRIIEEEEGELRPLVPKTDRESVLRGEDYWIDYREVDAAAARREARAKAPPPDQFTQEKMRAEIVNPYKQNWILIISFVIVALAGFIQLNPGILDDNPVGFPSEL